MNERRLGVRKRNVAFRERRRTVLICAEGKNKTEKLYFARFNQAQNKFFVCFASGNFTDSPNMVKAAKSDFCKMGCRKDSGFAFVVFDLDNENYKFEQAKKALKEADDYVFLVPSNPCFEIWFLLHFEQIDATHLSSKETIKRLERFLLKYEKSRDYFTVLYPRTESALINAARLKPIVIKQASRFSSSPSTNVASIVGLLMGDKGNDR